MSSSTETGSCWPSRRCLLLGFALLAVVPHAATHASAQVLIQGQVHAVDPAAPADRLAMSTILAIGHLPGSASEAVSFRTWETHPAGWFRLSGLSGRYTLAFTNPAHFFRPRMLTNQFLRDGDSIDLRLLVRFDFACFHDKAWDPEPARRYLQPFFARGTSVTAVGFKLATDGVDGPGPGKQDVLVSVHRLTRDDPEKWPQVGPTATVLGVDCGGAKSYWYSAGWRSAEVPLEPGERYAVSIRPVDPDGAFQAFWRPRPGGSAGVFRVGVGSSGFEPQDIWLAVSSDGDGLVIPYNKRVHRKFSGLTSLERKWSQTWVASGRGLASVVVYAAVSGKQPPLSRQRVRIRVRRGGPQGPLVGVEKIGIGNGNYTGDASWGHFVAAFAPGEVALEPGETYALELESIETEHTIGGFVNIKGQTSDGRAGFNPYRKCPPDDYPQGTAYRGGTEAVDFDLDLQIVEYAHARNDWEGALAGGERIINGSMEHGAAGADSAGEYPRGWRAYQLEEGTAHVWPAGDTDARSGRYLRLEAAKPGARVDGGWVQRVAGLRATETYRLSARVRSTWPASVDRSCRLGLDATGQIDDPEATTIEWRVLPPRHGEFVEFSSQPIRPQETTLSIWLRARCENVDERFPFRADFDDVSLRRVDTGPPVPQERGVRAGFVDRILPVAEHLRPARLELVRRRRGYTPVLVHRGASRFAPENTLAAFSAALDRGADGFEVDIRRSRDGVLYVFHDDTLDRVSSCEGKVRGKSYFELLGCEIGGGGHRVPTLAAVFTLARDRAALLHLDVKEPGLEADILRLIDAADLWEHIVEVNAGNATSIRDHEKIDLLNYKGWFPQDDRPEPRRQAAERQFLERPGNMVFTKWDPIDAVRALGRDAREPRPLPENLFVTWEEDGPRR